MHWETVLHKIEKKHKHTRKLRVRGFWNAVVQPIHAPRLAYSKANKIVSFLFCDIVLIRVNKFAIGVSTDPYTLLFFLII